RRRERRREERRGRTHERDGRDDAAPDALAEPPRDGHRQQRSQRHREEREPELRAGQVGVALDRRNARRPRPEQEAVGEEDERDCDARPAHHASTTSTPAARNGSSAVAGAELSVTKYVSSSSRAI